MSTAPPPWDPANDPDEEYRRASALDPSRPSEATRHAVLSHAARLAAARARADARRRWLSFAGIASGWRPALAGTLAAAVLAAVVIAPQLLMRRPSPLSESESGPAPVAPPPVAAAPAAGAAVQPVEAVRPSAAVHPPQAAPPPAPANAFQETRVTANRRTLPASTPNAQAAPAALADTAINRPADASGALEEERTVRRASSATAAVARAAPAAQAAAPAAQAAGSVPFDARALQRAAATGDMGSLNEQLAAPGYHDMPDAEGRTPLMLATLFGQKAAVAALLAHGANPNTADEHGTTPLAAALAAGEPEIATLLRQYGAR
ncbi:MAG TPA: ankyrin repeat domain-containing protein [Steroidobacteraceae bacterium]|nr:ankyrin repeat domain-containing protein [Steroidobacteraceae bacterium]